jgi:hypothetical protein
MHHHCQQSFTQGFSQVATGERGPEREREGVGRGLRCRFGRRGCPHAARSSWRCMKVGTCVRACSVARTCGNCALSMPSPVQVISQSAVELNALCPPPDGAMRSARECGWLHRQKDAESWWVKTVRGWCRMDASYAADARWPTPNPKMLRGCTHQRCGERAGSTAGHRGCPEEQAGAVPAGG